MFLFLGDFKNEEKNVSRFLIASDYVVNIKQKTTSLQAVIDKFDLVIYCQATVLYFTSALRFVAGYGEAKTRTKKSLLQVLYYCTVSM